MFANLYGCKSRQEGHTGKEGFLAYVFVFPRRVNLRRLYSVQLSHLEKGINQTRL